MTKAPAASQNTRRLAPRFLLGAVILAGLLVLMQLARYVVPGLKLDNPPVKQTTTWDSTETARLWEATCGDCHSNETVYPWYSYVAPAGWLVAHDVHEGRDHLNISRDSRVDVGEMIEVVREGEMPPQAYTIMHPEARLSDAEKQALIDGLRATFGPGSDG